MDTLSQIMLKEDTWANFPLYVVLIIVFLGVVYELGLLFYGLVGKFCQKTMPGVYRWIDDGISIWYYDEPFHVMMRKCGHKMVSVLTLLIPFLVIFSVVAIGLLNFSQQVVGYDTSSLKAAEIDTTHLKQVYPGETYPLRLSSQTNAGIKSINLGTMTPKTQASYHGNSMFSERQIDVKFNAAGKRYGHVLDQAVKHYRQNNPGASVTQSLKHIRIVSQVTANGQLKSISATTTTATLNTKTYTVTK